MPEDLVSKKRARYDGIADWYDVLNSHAAQLNSPELAELLGPGAGLCLDLGCGTGQYFDAIRDTGRTPIGLDHSADQLRLAARRLTPVLRADAAVLPFAADVFPAVTCLWISTDVDDFDAVLKEVARVIRPGGLLVVYGVHPCFNGPAVQAGEDGDLVIHPTYRIAGWHEPAPWWKANGIRRRTGVRHLPLMDLLNGLIEVGLTIDRVMEPGDQPIPVALAVRARKSA